MPRFAANLSLLFTELPLLARIAAAREAGFAAVEVQFPYDAPAEAWHDALASASMPLVLFNVPAGDLMAGGDGLAGVPGREAMFESALAQCVGYARVLRPRCINVLAGRLPAGTRREDALAVLRTNLAKARDALAPLGVTVTLEAINPHDMPRFLVDGFETMRAVVGAVPGTAMQYDIYHMARTGEPVAAQVAAHGARFGHVQFADLPGRHQPGTGRLDFPALFAALDGSGFTGWCGAEYRPTGTTPESLHWLPGRQAG